MWEALGHAALYGVLGILLLSFGYKLFDWIELKIDLAEEIKKGNMSAGIAVAGFLIGLGMIIGRAIGS